LETEEYTLEMVIHRYMQNSLPLNVARLLQAGICNSKGYLLLEYATMGSAREFINGLINGNYDDEFRINDEDKRYQVFINFLLQVIFTLGHLQTSELEFFHGDCKPENFLVNRLDTYKYPMFTYIINSRKIEIANLGFVVQIADFNKSSISLHSSSISKKNIRIVGEIKYKRILGSFVNELINDYSDHHISALPIGEIKIGNLLSNLLLPKSVEPFITVIRLAGVPTFRYIDLYIFFLILINTKEMLEYVLKHKLYMTVMGFMSNAFLDELFDLEPKKRTLNEAAYEIYSIFKKIKEPMRPIFTDDYFATLELLNLYLIKPPEHIE
jgi:serine/threonine protein kinase